MSSATILTTTISANYGLLVSLVSAGLRVYGTHKMKTTFIQLSRLGNKSFKSSWGYIFGFTLLTIATALEIFSYTISTIVLTIPTLLSSTLVLSRLYSSYTNGVMRWSDLGCFGLVTIGITLISVSLRADDIVYPSEKLQDLAEKAGSITFGSISFVFTIVNIYWLHRVSKNEYDDYLISLVSSPGKALIPEKEYDERMHEPLNEDMQRQAMELEVEHLLTKPKNASDVTNLDSARREIRRLRRMLNHVVVENSRYGESILSKGEIHLRNFRFGLWTRITLYAFVTAVWTTLLMIMTKSFGEIVESAIKFGWKSENFWQIPLIFSIALITSIPYTWAANRGMHEHGNSFAAVHKTAFLILSILNGLFFFEESDLVKDSAGFLIGVTLVMLCLRFKTVEATRLVHVEVSIVPYMSPNAFRSSWFLFCGSQRCLRIARFSCPTLATIDIAAYTDCDELPSMNEAKLQWCRMSNVQIIDEIDDHDEDEEEKDSDKKEGEDMEMVTIERHRDIRKSISGQNLKDMSTNDVEKALNVKVRAYSAVENIDNFDSVCSRDSNDDDTKLEDDMPSAFDDFRRMSTNFDEHTDSGSSVANSIRRRKESTSHKLPSFVPFKDFVAKYQMSRSVLRPNFTGEVKSYQTYGEPKEFKVRGSKYLIDKVKIPCGEPLLRLVGVDLHECDASLRRHIMSQPTHHAHQYIYSKNLNASWLFVVNFIVPTGNISAYWTSRSPCSKWIETLPDSSLLSRFIKGSDNFRNKRLKLIPKIVSGNWFVRKVVGSKPAILGTKGLGMKYYVTKKYLEIDIDLTTSRVANGIWSVVQQYAESLVVDLAFVIESQHMTELPETLLCSVRFHHIRFMKRKDIIIQDEENGKAGDDDEEEDGGNVVRPASPTGSIHSIRSTDKENLLVV